MTKRPDDEGAAGNENAWLQWDKANELKDEIKKDLNRLYPSGCDEHHFTQPVIQKLMCDVLFVWSCLHKATSYRQVGADTTYSFEQIFSAPLFRPALSHCVLRVAIMSHFCLLSPLSLVVLCGCVQGMHEVLAVILYALQQEAGSLGGDHPYSYLTDPAFLEHDVFVIFEKVMMELEVRTIYISYT